MVPVCALCHVSMIACRRRSGLMWCQKNGGRVAASPRLSSIRFVRSWFIRLYTAIASSWQYNLRQWPPSRAHIAFVTGRTYPHCAIVALVMWIVMVEAQGTHELVLRYTRSYRSRHCSKEPQFPEDDTRNNWCSNWPMQWTAPGLMKPLEGLTSYITVQDFTLCYLEDRSKQTERPTTSTRLAVR
jgi:hypothetical protein